MAITESFKKAIKARDIRGIRIMMKDSLLIDPTFHEFEAMEKLTQDISGLYDVHDGREFILDSSAWDDTYMNMLMVQIVGNFSHERMDHLKVVVQQLRPIAGRSWPTDVDGKQTASSPLKTPPAHPAQTRTDNRSGHNTHSKGATIVVGAVLGCAAGGFIAAAAGCSVVTGTVVGAVVLGATAALVTDGGR